MLGTLTRGVALAAVAGSAVCLTEATVKGQLFSGRGGTYFHAPPQPYGSYGGLFGHYPAAYSTSYYAPAYGYAPAYSVAPAYGYSTYSTSYYTTGLYPATYSSYYAPTAYAPVFGYAPYRKLEYDVYTPYGKQEVEYKYHRNGTVTVDIDD